MRLLSSGPDQICEQQKHGAKRFHIHLSSASASICTATATTLTTTTTTITTFIITTTITSCTSTFNTITHYYSMFFLLKKEQFFSLKGKQQISRNMLGFDTAKVASNSVCLKGRQKEIEFCPFKNFFHTESENIY